MSKEHPVLIGYVQTLDAYSYTDDGVPMERKPLRPGEVWLDYDALPPTPPAPSPWPGTAAALTTGVLAEPLVATADPLRFTTAPSSRLSLVLPGNVRAAAYRARLSDAAGRSIPYDPSVWVVDGLERVVAFKVKTPTELGYALPLSLTYWIYTGGIVGDVPVEAIANVGAGPGAIYKATVAGVAELRTIEGDSSGTAVATVGDTVQIGETLTGANVGAGAQVFETRAGDAMQLRSVTTGDTGITVTQTATEITIGNAITGTNLGVGEGQLYAGKSGSELQFNTLADGGDGFTVSAPSGGVVTIDNTMGGSNLGGGAGTPYVGRSATRLQTNTISGTSGITTTVASNLITVNNNLTGLNVGTGTGNSVFRDKSSGVVRFRGIAPVGASGGGLGVGGVLTSSDATDIYLRLAMNAWYVSDVKASGTAGGTSTSATTHIRTLNTIVNATNFTVQSSGVTLSGNNLTFDRDGTYFIFGAAPNQAGDGTRAGLYNNTTAAFMFLGGSTFNPGDTATNPAAFSGVLATPALGTTYSVRQYVTTGKASTGLGLPVGLAGRSEVYTWLYILQIATNKTGT